MISRLLVPLVGLLSPVLMAQRALAAPTSEVLSVVGVARAEGRLLAAGQRVKAGATVELVSHDAVVQLLLADRLAVGLCGRATARLLGPGGDLELSSSSVARVAGRGTVSMGQRRVTVAPDGVVVVHGGRLYVVEGSASVARDGSREVVGPGYALSMLRPGGPGARRRQVPEGVAARTLVYQPPSPWSPGEEAVEVGAQVHRAQKRVRARQQRARELATCGCTEGSGPGVSVDRGPNQTSIEGRRGTLRVRVRGVPRRSP